MLNQSISDKILHAFYYINLHLFIKLVHYSELWLVTHCFNDVELSIDRNICIKYTEIDQC